eukprot:tig00021319_g20222.t1
MAGATARPASPLGLPAGRGAGRLARRLGGALDVDGGGRAERAGAAAARSPSPGHSGSGSGSPPRYRPAGRGHLAGRCSCRHCLRCLDGCARCLVAPVAAAPRAPRRPLSAGAVSGPDRPPVVYVGAEPRRPQPFVPTGTRL